MKPWRTFRTVHPTLGPIVTPCLLPRGMSARDVPVTDVVHCACGWCVAERAGLETAETGAQLGLALGVEDGTLVEGADGART